MRLPLTNAATTASDSFASSASPAPRRSRTGLLAAWACAIAALAPVLAHAAAQSCDEAGLNAAIAAGGTNTFSCGGPTTVTVSGTKTISVASLTLDGGGLLTLSGGGVRRVFIVNNTSNTTFQNLTIVDGFVNGGNGAAILNFGTVAVINSTFSGNTIVDGGGAALGNVGAMTVDRSTFLSNSITHVSSVADGAAINNNGSSLAVSNSTFSLNSAQRGGAILASTGMSIYNSTIVGNTGTISCGAGGIFAVGTTTLFNTIVANNTSSGCADNCNGTVVAGSDSISDTTDCSSATQKTLAQINLGGLTGSPSYFPLNPGSAAIDAGDNTACAGTPVNDLSQNGLTRPIDGNGDGISICDVGSFEAPLAIIAAPAQVPTLTGWATMLLALVLGWTVFARLNRRRG